MNRDRIFYDEVTGAPSNVVETITRRVSAYTRSDRVRKFWIGISNNPEGRFRQRYARKYDEMIVLYRTSSIDFASQLEQHLIDHNWSVAANRIAGGGGDIGGPPYFLYIVLSH